jgi:hypothetical protein
MKSSYTERAARFLRTIYPLLDGHWNSPWECRRIMSLYSCEHSRKVFVRSGVSRIAIITSDYVIKFDYNEREVNRVGGCESEVEFYQFAKQEGFGYLFAEITPFIYNGRTFYIMPRVNGVGRVEYSYAEDFLEGEERAFADEYLNDLHDENYGWYHKRPVIFDYACNQLWLDNHGYNNSDSDYYSSYRTHTEEVS